MSKFFGIFIVVALISFSAEAKKTDCLSNRGHELSFPKGKKIRILSYDAKSKTYLVESFDFSGEGSVAVVPEALSESVPSLTSIASILKSKPDDIVDEVYTTQKELPTMFPQEVSARAECLRQK